MEIKLTWKTRILTPNDVMETVSAIGELQAMGVISEDEKSGMIDDLREELGLERRPK